MPAAEIGQGLHELFDGHGEVARRDWCRRRRAAQKPAVGALFEQIFPGLLQRQNRPACQRPHFERDPRPIPRPEKPTQRDSYVSVVVALVSLRNRTSVAQHLRRSSVSSSGLERRSMSGVDGPSLTSGLAPFTARTRVRRYHHDPPEPSTVCTPHDQRTASQPPMW